MFPLRVQECRGSLGDADAGARHDGQGSTRF